MRRIYTFRVIGHGLPLHLLGHLTEATQGRQWIESALSVWQHCVEGHHYSAIYADDYPSESAAAQLFVFRTEQGWTTSKSDLALKHRQHGPQHPIYKLYCRQRAPSILRRSELVTCREWRNSKVYNELDRRLSVKDMLTLFLPLGGRAHLTLNCGRDSLFSDPHSDLHYLPCLLDNLLAGRLQRSKPPAQIESQCRAISQREAQVLYWVARGERNADIARTLFLSPLTVRRHMENIFAKLRVRSRTEAVQKWAAARPSISVGL